MGGLENPIKILFILLLVLLIFGAKRLPEIGRGMGKGLREFRDATKGLGDDVKSGQHDEARPAQDAKSAEPRPAEPPKTE